MKIVRQAFSSLDNFFRGKISGISSVEKKAIAAAALVLILAASLPMALILLKRAPGQYFSGLEASSSDDLAVYFSYIYQASKGAFYLKDLYTLEPGAGTINLVWQTIGIFAKIFDLAPQYAFHISRIILIPPLVFVFYISVSFFVKNKAERMTALFLALFGSGLGAWFYPFLKTASWSVSGRYSAPLDLSVPEFLPFWSALYSPHFILSWICLTASVVLLIKTFEDYSIKRAIFAGVLGLFYFHFHPYYAPFLALFALGLFVHSWAQKRKFKGPLRALIVYFVLCAPPILYHAALIFYDYASYARAAQNQTWSPPLLMSLMGAGMFLPFAIFGAVEKGAWDFRRRALIFWAILHPIFMYIPFSNQRRFSEGWIFPLAILSAAGLGRFYASAGKFVILTPATKKIFLAAAFFIFFVYSNYSILFLKSKQALWNSGQPYIEESFVRAVRLNIAPGTRVLSAPRSALFIPYVSGASVYAGHWAETIFSKEKFRTAAEFYSDKTSDDWRKDFLKNNKIDFVFWGAEESALGVWSPFEKDFLRMIYGDGQNFVFVIN